MLSLVSLSVSVGKKKLIHQFSLDCKPGEITCIIGHNGVGKSSLLKSIAGIGGLSVTGQVTLGSSDLLAMSPDLRYKVGILLLYQSPPVLEGVTVFQLCRAIAGDEITTTQLLLQIKTTAKLLGLPEDLYTKVVNQDLSGGQKKLLELLQAVLFRPKVLLCDEIDSGLDVTKQKKVVQILTQLATEGMTILCVTHSLSQVSQLCPSVVVLLNTDNHVIGGLEILEKVEEHGYTQD